MDINCLKNFYGESVLTQIAKIKMTGSIIGPVGGKFFFFFFFKLPGRLLVRPWPDQPDRLLRPYYTEEEYHPQEPL